MKSNHSRLKECPMKIPHTKSKVKEIHPLRKRKKERERKKERGRKREEERDGGTKDNSNSCEDFSSILTHSHNLKLRPVARLSCCCCCFAKKMAKTFLEEVRKTRFRVKKCFRWTDFQLEEQTHARENNVASI